MEKISKKQQEMVDFISKYISNYGYSPTIREIAYVFQRSTGSILPMLRRLKAKGLIDYEEKKSRTIKILN